MFVEVVLPSVVVNRIILIGSLPKNKCYYVLFITNLQIECQGFVVAFSIVARSCVGFWRSSPQPKSINVAYNKVGEHVSPCILRTSMKNLQWKHILTIRGLTTLLVINLPSNVSSTRFA